MSDRRPEDPSDETPAGTPELGTGHHAEDDPQEEHGASGKRLMLLSLAAVGIVYGDIGTSPIYALRESFHHTYGIEAVAPNILGVLSLIFWSLVLVISIKYLGFILKADNGGEGGIIALTALVSPPGEEETTRRRKILGLVGLFAAATTLWFLTLAVLGVTGGEALYADPGHFGTRPIRLTWFALVLPAVLRTMSVGGEPVKPLEVTYFLGRERLIPTEKPGMAIWREKLFALMSRNTTGATSYFRIPSNQVVELGMQLEI